MFDVGILRLLGDRFDYTIGYIRTTIGRCMITSGHSLLSFSGGYTDVSSSGQEYLARGQMARRLPSHKHTVVVDPEGCWSLLITGPKVRGWGFWRKGKWVKANKYFLEEGKHVCN